MKPNQLLGASAAIVTCCLLFSFRTNTTVQKVTLQEALDAGMISAEVVSVGGHSGNCINASFTNLTNTPLEVTVEPGRRFTSVDESKQDILITKEKPLILAGNQTESTPLYGFCTQVHNDSPTSGDAYQTGYVVEDNTLELARFLNKNPFPRGAEQSAIWTVANGNDITTIHHSDRDSIENLLHFVAKIEGVEVPQYTMDYLDTEDGMFSGIPTKFQATVSGRFDEQTQVHLILYSPEGRSIIRSWLQFEPSAEEQQKSVEMDIQELPKGAYTLKAFDKGTFKKLEEYTVQI